MTTELSGSRSVRDLAEMVRTELHWVEDLDPSAIVVSEHHGHIALTGRVRSWAEREGSVRAARRVPGVRAIEADGLKIRTCLAGPPRDRDLAKAAGDALRWHLAVPHQAIQVSAHEGTVTLEGAVDRPCQREAAEAAVRPLEGVRAIDDRIRVRGSCF
jgi:osmotically-inducible protein OsmY